MKRSRSQSIRPETTGQVDSRTVLRAVLYIRRRGSNRVLAELESLEPDMAEYLMEELTRVYHQLLELRGPARQTMRLQQQIQDLVLVGIFAMRQTRSGQKQ